MTPTFSLDCPGFAGQFVGCFSSLFRPSVEERRTSAGVREREKQTKSHEFTHTQCSHLPPSRTHSSPATSPSSSAARAYEPLPSINTLPGLSSSHRAHTLPPYHTFTCIAELTVRNFLTDRDNPTSDLFFVYFSTRPLLAVCSFFRKPLFPGLLEAKHSRSSFA